MVDYYATRGVSRDAGADEIRKALGVVFVLAVLSLVGWIVYIVVMWVIANFVTVAFIAIFVFGDCCDGDYRRGADEVGGAGLGWAGFRLSPE